MATDSIDLTDEAVKGSFAKLLDGYKSKVVERANPKLIKKKMTNPKLTPSAFMREMSLDTKQKLAATREMHIPPIVELLDMTNSTLQKYSSLDTDQPLFQPFPSEITFQNYKPCEVYEVPLSLRNHDQVPRMVKVIQEDSPYFRIVYPSDVSCKVAPGMATTFKIIFTPEENKDYIHELVCITEREKFLVPVKAIGARAVLDFPDQINFSVCPVKYNTQKTLLVRNVGNREAKFILQTKTPFHVVPIHGKLDAGESVQVTVEFIPQSTGNHSEDLMIHLDTGEDIFVNLYGAAEDVNVRLDKSSVMIEKTYITLANQRVVSICNRSNIIVHFQWKAFATPEEEQQQKLRFFSDLISEEEEVTDYFLQECAEDPALHESISILSRTFLNRRRMVQDDKMLLSDDTLFIEPVEGDVWPNSTTEISIICRPQQAKVFQWTVYCDVTGRETRLPLRIKAEGIGPKLLLNFDQIDMGFIIINSKHMYEMLMMNKGAIHAAYSLMPAFTPIGSCFSINPSSGSLLPGDYQVLDVTFKSNILGEFQEDLMFSVEGCPQPISVTFKGCVIGPTFNFNVPSLNFGEISYGFPSTISCRLINTSIVAMTFNLWVAGDGTAEVTPASDNYSLDGRRVLSWTNIGYGVKPKEFTIKPNYGTIKAQEEMEIQVTLCSNTVKKYESALVVDIEQVGQEVLAIPVSARCVVPIVEVINSHIDLGRCFLKYPYKCLIKLHNTQDLPACYGVVPQELDDQQAVVYSSPKPYGIIESCHTVEVPLLVELQSLGEQSAELSIAIFGQSYPPLQVHLTCTGEGPVVQVTCTEIDWGKINVLSDVPKTFGLSNESLVPANITAKMAMENSKWRLLPSETVIPPLGHVDMTIVAHLDDTIWSEDKVILLIEDSHAKCIHVQAKGTGCTIVSNKPFGPHLNLGSLFSSQVCHYSVKLTNRGRRHHQIYWKTEGFPLIFKPSPQKQPMSLDMKYKISPPPKGQYVPSFRVRPLRMDLEPGQSALLVLEGESDMPQVVRGQLVGSAIIGKQFGKEKIKTVNILCEFIGPILELSTKQLNFRVDKLQHEQLVPQYKSLALKNVSPLSLTLNLSTNGPFTIVEKQNEEALIPSKSVKVDVGENLELFIQFDPSYKNDLYTREVEEILSIQYLEHPHVDYVSLRGEVNFPNLHFETTTVDFGCILNDTEMVQHVTMTNCSSLLVRYRWSFLSDDSVYQHSSPVCRRGTETEQLKTNESNNRTKLTDEASIQESALLTEDDDRTLSNYIMNFNQEEQTYAENETQEDVGSPKESSSIISNKGQKERSSNLVGSELLPEDQTEDSKCLLRSCNKEQNDAVMGVEQVFDILPLFGVLQANESQRMTFTFYGHTNVSSKVKAVCEVEGGPVYEITLKGEASFIKYEFDRKMIDYGHQLFNHDAVTEITLKNTGKVAFDFTVLNAAQTADKEPQPGVPLITPSMGCIEANAEQQLQVTYLPGVPEIFYKSFEIQISHFEPDSITVKGEGTFPRIYLDLPRCIKGNETYEAFLKKAKEAIETETSECSLLHRPETIAGELGAANSLSSYDTLLQMEADRLLIKEYSLVQESILSSYSGVSRECQYPRSCLSRCPLPEFFLDFGFVILGTVKKHIVKITNTGFLPVSFHTDQHALKNTGFSTELHRVKNLPCCETETFEVRFDPRSANLGTGYAKALILIQVVGGPTVKVILQATVTEPDLTVSSEQLDFGSVQCGQCQVITIQLYNRLQVPCEWSFTDTSLVKQKLDKHVPLYLRSKRLKELKRPSYVFVMLPPCGVINAGERVNVQVTFTPTEEKLYNHRLVLNLAQSSNRVLIMARGQGLEPRLDFSTTVLELGPILPYGTEAERTVIVKNPCSFPIEFYSVEFDERYLEEEKVLRMTRGYSSLNTLLLPPRQPGKKLPMELFDYYKEQILMQAQEQAKMKIQEGTEGENDVQESEVEEKPSEQTDKLEWQVTSENIRQPSESDVSSRPAAASPLEEKKVPETEAAEKAKGEKPEPTISVGVGELEATPVSMALGRYLGLDLSPEACGARNRRGIAFIVHGTPCSGKTTTAIFLANHYQVAYLTVDSIVQEAVSSGTSSVALQAQELYAKATLEQMLKENEEAHQEGSTQLGGINPDAVIKQAPNSSPVSEVKPASAAANAQTKTSQVTSRTSHIIPKQQTDYMTSQISTNMQVVQQPVSITTSQIGDANPISFPLPEDMLVELLTERLQLNDCCQGFVFDGLENQHSNNETSTLLAVLKAINNRRHIYFITLSQDYALMKIKKKAKLQAEEQLAKEEAEKERTYLKELDEDEYEALTEEQRAEFDFKRTSLFRERREKVLNEIHERQLMKQKEKEVMERLREEEELKKKSKKGRKEVNIKEDTKKLQMSTKMNTNITTVKTEAPETKAASTEHHESIQIEHVETEEGTRKRKSRDVRISQAFGEKSNLFQEDEVTSSPGKQLYLRFQKYERNRKKISQILEFWDRVQGTIVLPPSEDGQSAGEEQSMERPVPSSKKGKKDRHEKLEKERAEKERAEKEKAEKERLEKLREEKTISSPQSDGEAVESTEKEESIGVPQVRVSANDPEENIGKTILDSGKIPSVEEILDSLGLGPSGPPIPPAALFSVVRYPVERRPSSGQDVLSHFSLSSKTEEQKNLFEDKKESELEQEVMVPVIKEEAAVQQKGKSKKDKIERAEDKRRPGGHRKGRRDSRSSIVGAPSPLSDVDHSSGFEETAKEETTAVRAPPYRWIVQPGEEVALQVNFSSVECGTFDQTLNFELLGTQRCYKLYCRGICTFPTISQDPRVVFRHRIKSLKQQEIPRKKYVMSTGVFQFGALLCGITRERYKEGQHPENREIIKVVNTSSMEAEVFFCYQHDIKAATYLVDPPSLTLAAHQERDITIWAYPTSPGKFDDSLVCCIRENPEPVLFKVSCYGVRAELEVDRKQLHFDKIILHRKDTKSLVMRNICLLPVAWRITGLENLGDDFSLSHDQGVIEPKAEFCVHMHFRATRQMNLRKYIRLEVYDAENIIGIVQTENILVLAEAYDVALDITFPKGTDGGIDFGIIKVNDTVKQTITLKNKGKYEIGYKFHLQPTKCDMPDLNSLFSIQPIKGSLSPNDRPSHIYINFHSNVSTEIKDEPVLRCQVIEPTLGEGGEIIASIPVKISIHAVFSTYQILPAKEVNFGTVLVGGRRSRTFILENTGEFDFKYFIFKMPAMPSHQSKKNTSVLKSGKANDRSSSVRSNVMLKQKEQTAQARLTIGMFTVFPGYGVVSPGAQQTITVECSGDQIGKHEELLSIDVTDRDPKDNPSGIPYWLVIECCAPSIVVDDIRSIFEEHFICQNINLHQCLQIVETSGIYVEDEKKFLFHNVHVGDQAEARLKIINVGKVSADVVVSVKPISNKITARIVDIFDVEPIRMNVPSYGHKFVTIRFSPQTMQNYHCIFEAMVEAAAGIPKGKSLLFDIVGEGNLPRINILRPLLRNKIGNPLLIYSRLLLGQTEKLPVVLKNDGTLPAQVSINLSDDCGVFSLKQCIGTKCLYPKESHIKEEDPSRVRESCMLTIKLNSGEEAMFDVAFKPTMAQRFDGTLYLTIFNNQYEDTIIHLVGEGYQDDVTLDNIHGLLQSGEEENITSFLEDKEIEATHLNHIQFGDCHISKPYQVTFTMTNRSATDVVRFHWFSDIKELKISPQFGHLHAGCAKDMTVTLKSDLPITYNSQAVKCMMSKIIFPVPVDQVPDWDNRLSVVKWIDAGTGVRPAKKKVVEIDPEPVHSVLEDSTQELELKISAMVDYSNFECLCDSIIFKDTLLHQSRIYVIVLANKGAGALEYSWKVLINGHGGGENIQAATSVLGTDTLTGEEYGVASMSSLIADPLTKSIQAVSRASTAAESPSTRAPADLDNAPFTVEPPSGTIAATGAQEFTVKFAPLDVGEFEALLICRIPNLKTNSQGHEIAVQGRSLLPYCHFELEDSNYLSSHRRKPELSGPWNTHPGIPLDPNTRVIEFQTVGLNTVIKRSFYIMNPTNIDYSFQWMYENVPVVQVEPSFSCLTETGFILAGKKTEVTFEFVSQQLGITESFWSFKIPQLNISVPFLLCGDASEPAVSFDRSHVNYKCVLLGQKARKTAYLINNEATPFSFHFKEVTAHSEGYGCRLVIEPMEGIVLPHSRLPVVFSCSATAEGEVNFNVVCDVKTKVAPLNLNVKMHVYSMNVVVKCEASDGTVTELNQQSVNEIAFGEVELNDRICYYFIIANNGDLNFDFEWELSGPPRSLSCFKLTCKERSVEAGNSVSSKFEFQPDHKLLLEDVKLTLQILKGPRFACVLTGYTVSPSIHLSFTTCDFGVCFIYNAGMTPHKKILIITNKQEQPVSLECLFPTTSYLEVKFQPCTLAPKKSVQAVITFYPREPIRYKEKVTFAMNGLSYQNVQILGQGTEMKVEVAIPKNKVVYLQPLRVGQTVRKIVPIINRSLAPVNFILSMTPNQQLLQNTKVLSLSPKDKITLKAQGGSCNVAVTFSPVCRIPEFAEEVRMELPGVSKALFVIRGCCQATEIVLDQDCITFGAVILRSKATRLVMLKNIGDIGASFRWEIEKIKPHFSISPVEGYLSPGMEVSLQVEFHPVAVNTDIRVQDLNCFIERAKSLQIHLTGSCVPASAMKEVISFICNVRTKQTHAIQLTNRTNQIWNLWPIIEGEYWMGAKNIIVQPHQQNHPYEITYRPLTMSLDGKKHQGSIFFPLPDGAGLLYMLQGVAEPPKAVAVINREVPCKTSHTVIFSISNWLHSAQRFRAITELIKPEWLENTTTLKGLDYVDVPGSSQRDYRLNFYSYKETNISVKMIFRNETTLEYLFYILNIKSTPPGIISTIELTAPVRQSTSGMVEVENPLTVPTVFSTECKLTDIILPAQLIVPPQAKGVLTFEYQPLREGESSGRLTLNNNELGTFQYELVLRAGPAGHERPVYFRTTLGSCQVLGAKFTNLSRQKLEYHCKVDNAEFLVDKSITVHPASPGGSEVSVDVTYEPLQLGESRATLNIVSPIGGKYSIPLFGFCLPAKPQGPFTIRAGSTTSIPFKNIFPQVKTFSFQPDNPMFACKSTETLRPKKSHFVTVSFEASANTPRSPVIGKLVVSCPQSEGTSTVISWIYYLKGVNPDK
ncbi:hydrocephalus-inducing protein homolog isoform X2 [Hypanus sabinus]|uniref:hydrocephalus-inducing protein homolog isoform X2 n=1 Tax=Hypanus sabinus TaxID=79690 RepID=UPI0028C4BAA5|nr:hydrocephalus-inducing protein homolog isoform X2 [Hypanus sabinus]